jgi:hypothetical protein
LQPGTYTIDNGEMTMKGAATRTLVEIGDTLEIVAGGPLGYAISFSGKGLFAKEKVVFEGFADKSAQVMIASAVEASGNHTIVVREALRLPKGCLISLLALRRPGGDDSGGEWGGKG